LAGWSEGEVLGRLTILSDELSTKLLLSQVAIYKRAGNQEGISEIAEGGSAAVVRSVGVHERAQAAVLSPRRVEAPVCFRSHKLNHARNTS